MFLLRFPNVKYQQLQLEAVDRIVEATKIGVGQRKLFGFRTERIFNFLRYHNRFSLYNIDENCKLQLKIEDIFLNKNQVTENLVESWSRKLQNDKYQKYRLME